MGGAGRTGALLLLLSFFPLFPIVRAPPPFSCHLLLNPRFVSHSRTRFSTGRAVLSREGRTNDEGKGQGDMRGCSTDT